MKRLVVVCNWTPHGHDDNGPIYSFDSEKAMDTWLERHREDRTIDHITVIKKRWWWPRVSAHSYDAPWKS